MSITRRGVIRGGGALLANSVVFPGEAFSDVVGAPDPSRPTSRLDDLVSAIRPELRMWNQNTDERMSCRFFGPEGYDKTEIDRVNWFMRDWREEEVVQMDVRVLWALAGIRQAAMKDGHDGEIRFLSGYRSRKTNDALRRAGRGAARNSFHIEARAIDFSLPGMPVKGVFDYAQWLEIGGVGYYPGSFVHIDSGDLRTWTG